MIEKVLEGFGLNNAKAEYKTFGSGLINNTWKVSSLKGNYILQKVNNSVFSSPRAISENILMIKDFLDQAAPDYLFIAPIKTVSGDSILELDGNSYRLFPFVNQSITIDEVGNADQAYQAANQFGKFTKMLATFNPQKLHIPIKDFHNLVLRVQQYQKALKTASEENKILAKWAIEEIERHYNIVETYEEIIAENQLTVRVFHHDTKISNVLLNTDNGEGICVIDLDTVMPGTFISDVGDMIRTYLSPYSEEETRFDLITVREEIFAAIYKGYMNEMEGILTDSEKNLFLYAGKFIIFMQALRFLTDFLNGDIYYSTTYPKQNLNRATNQIYLLNSYIKSIPDFEIIIKNGKVKNNFADF